VHLMFSYYAWLNGDMSTAIGSAQTAEASLGAALGGGAGGRTGYVQRFREMLIAARGEPAAADTKR